MQPWYTTREAVLRATDAGESVRNAARVDLAVASASRSIDRLVARPVGAFAPSTRTLAFDWPHGSQPFPSQIDFGVLPLHSVSAFTSGGTVIAASDYLLRPDVGPPYYWVEVDSDSDAALSVDGTAQGSATITGTWGILGEDVWAGTLAAAITTTTATTLSASGGLSALAGVGSILLVGDERLIVTARSSVSSGQVTGAPMLASRPGIDIAVSDGFGFAVGETLLIGGERVVIEDIVGNMLYVQRAAYGSTLAAHDTGTAISTYRTLTVVRGQLGTTATTHDSGATVDLYAARPDVEAATVALALLQLAQEQGGYARTGGGGTAKRPELGAGATAVIGRVVDAYGPRLRHVAV